jgi:Domain of unknown function (DUF5348)
VFTALKLFLYKPRNTNTCYFGIHLISEYLFFKGIFMDVQDNRKSSGPLIYNDEQKQLELKGYPLQRGERIEIRLMGYWIPGSIQLDKGGWYLLTYDYVGIRLHAGLMARRLRHEFTFLSASEQFPNALS